MKVAGSFWLYSPETNSWRLVIASPEVSEQGPKMIYDRILAVLSDKAAEAPELRLDYITAVTDSDPTYRVLRRAVKIGPAIGGLRFTRNVIDGHYIEDAWIYRLV